MKKEENDRKPNKEKEDFLKAVLAVVLIGTLLVLLILMLTLLGRNGTLAQWKAQYNAWLESLHPTEAPTPTMTPEEKLLHFGPEDGGRLSYWELFSWIPEAEKQEETIPEKRRDLTENPVNGSEAWWKDATRLAGTVTIYAQADTPLYGAPDRKSEVFGVTEEGEEFRLVAVFSDGWYVITDGDYYYCSEGSRFTMTVPEKPDLASLWRAEPVSYKVTNLLQKPELPYGCEVTALATLLNYYKIKADKCTLADKWLLKGEWGKTDFRKAFVGDPRRKTKSAGCYASAIEDTANRYLESVGSEKKAYSAEGISAEQLLELLDEAPVIVWTTMELKPSYIAQVWEVDGEELLWLNCEHSIVLTGYDFEKGVFYGSDPLYGSCEYDMQLFFLRFATMLSQAVWIR